MIRRPRLSTLLYGTVYTLLAVMLVLYLPALRSFLSTRTPLEEVRSDLSQVLLYQKLDLLAERRTVELIDVVAVGGDLARFDAVDQEMAKLMAELRASTEAEEEVEDDEWEELAELERNLERLQREGSAILTAHNEGDSDRALALLRRALGDWRGEVLPALDDSIRRERLAFDESVDDLLAASGHFAFLPFAAIEDRAGELRNLANETIAAAEFRLAFERLSSTYLEIAFAGRPAEDLHAARARSEGAFTAWRTWAAGPNDSGGDDDEVGEGTNGQSAASDALAVIETTCSELCRLGDQLVELGAGEAGEAFFRSRFEPLADEAVPALLAARAADDRRQVEEGTAALERQFRSAGQLVTGLALVLFALSLLVPWLLRRFFLKPVVELADAARALGDGDLERRAAPGGSREMAALADDFNLMAARLLEARDQLRRRERLAVLGELAGSIGHEIRNPLGAMKSSIFFLRRGQRVEDPKAVEHLGRIDRQIERANRIVSELLDYAREPRVEPERFALHVAAERALEEIEWPADETRTVSLEKSYEEPPVEVVADPGQIERVAGNLLRNALQALDGGGKVTIECRRRDDEALLAVVDDGPGVPAAERRRIFEPLISGKTRGIGLGLPLSRRYAEVNQGRLECAEIAGRGARFELVLPLLDDGDSP